MSKQQKLNAFLKDMTAFSDTATPFLDANGDNIIRLGQLSEPILALLARYSGGVPVPARGHRRRRRRRLANTFRGFVFHIDLITLPQQPRGYTAADQPVYGADNGPDCVGLPNPPIPYYPRGGSSRTSTTVSRASARVTTSAPPPASRSAVPRRRPAPPRRPSATG